MPAWLRVIAALTHWLSALGVMLVAAMAAYNVVQSGDAEMLRVAAVSGLVAAGAVVGRRGHLALHTSPSVSTGVLCAPGTIIVST